MCPLLVSVLAVAATLLVTMSVLFWNYSETRQRRMTKKQSIILDHWGKRSPLLQQDELENLLEGGVTYYGETALRSVVQPLILIVTLVTSDAILCSRVTFSLIPHRIGTRLTWDRKTEMSAKITKMTASPVS